MNLFVLCRAARHSRARGNPACYLPSCENPGESGMHSHGTEDRGRRKLRLRILYTRHVTFCYLPCYLEINGVSRINCEDTIITDAWPYFYP